MKRFQPRGRGVNISHRGGGRFLLLCCSEITIITMKINTFREDVLEAGRGQRPNQPWQSSWAWPVRIARGSDGDRSFQRAPRAKSFWAALILALSEVLCAPLRRNAFFSKDSEKSAAGEICRLEGRHSRKIVSPPLVGMSNFYNEFDNFFKGRSSSMARPNQDCSEIPNFYDEICASTFRPISLVNITRMRVTSLPLSGLHPKAVIPS